MTVLCVQGDIGHILIFKRGAMVRIREAAKKNPFFFGISFPNVGGWGG